MSTAAELMPAGSSPLAAAFTAGAGTGLRSFTPLAAFGATTLENNKVKGVIAAAAIQELIMDKLPKTPTRLAPLGIGARVVGAAGCGVLVARRKEASAQQQVLAAAVAASAALGTAYLGAKWRWWGAPRLGSDLAAALIEDLVALGLAGAALRS